MGDPLPHHMTPLDKPSKVTELVSQDSRPILLATMFLFEFLKS